MRKIVCTAITENFIDRAKRLFDTFSIIQTEGYERVVITLDFIASKELKEQYPYIEFKEQYSDLIKDELTHIKCLQHGAFTDVLELDDSDIVLFCDADIKIERDFLESENELISNLKSNDVIANYNNLSGMLLRDEITKLSITIPFEQIKEIIDIEDFENSICYNTGFVVANFETWKRLRCMYKPILKKIDKYIQHYAKQQWIMSLVMNKYFNPIIAPQTLHSHCHHDSMRNILTYIDEKLNYNYRVVMFNHKCYEFHN